MKHSPAQAPATAPANDASRGPAPLASDLDRDARRQEEGRGERLVATYPA